jgi:ADP-ribose pyrophosphatase YjhB (NUDIX family)
VTTHDSGSIVSGSQKYEVRSRRYDARVRRQIVSFGVNGRTFNFRAAAVIVHDSRVLLHRAEYEDFWSLPGGRVEMLEDSREALRREMLEELGEEVEIGRLVWVGENFFSFLFTDFHEMGMYFVASLPPSSVLMARTEEWWTTEDNGVKIAFCWFDVAEAATLPIVPGFLRDGLGTLPEQTEHVIYRDPLRWGSSDSPSGD